ncbi:MAG: hypothetical protein P4L85_19100 [Paludisphaera borealis]|uniref:hypothetical protein n=1 Tax=Paludisphaera borealis TaxID=1387353 RepID=UPI002842900B|nr:hypothetical protein [Paludisphaera borealis]MDR3621466.1 hypothetical protein [Paludisphaera borealis]
MAVPGRNKPRRRLILGAWAVLAAVAVGPGCLGPTALRTTRMKYNESVRVTNDEQLLMNIVRLRYADSPVFIDLPSITSQFELSGAGHILGGYGNQYPGQANIGFGEFTARDSPTLSYRPREGKEVAKALLTPLSAELFSVVNAGANLEQMMLLTLNDVNDVGNAPQATAMTPKAPDYNAEFLRGVRLMASLRERSATEIQVGYEEDADASSDPIAEKGLGGDDLLNAAKEGYVFRHRGEGRMALLKREKSLVLRVHRPYVDSPEMHELCRIFHLRPGLSRYRLKSEFSQNALDETPDAIETGETIYLNLRSILQMMVFLSKGVCVPEEHVAKNVAPSTPGPDGRPYNWTQITAGNFFVRSQKHRPRDAEMAVFYRGYWFYIPSNDVNSRAIMAILELLVSIEESETHTGGPLLTIPVGD